MFISLLSHFFHLIKLMHFCKLLLLFWADWFLCICIIRSCARMETLKELHHDIVSLFSDAHDFISFFLFLIIYLTADFSFLQPRYICMPCWLIFIKCQVFKAVLVQHTDLIWDIIVPTKERKLGIILRFLNTLPSLVCFTALL